MADLLEIWRLIITHGQERGGGGQTTKYYYTAISTYYKNNTSAFISLPPCCKLEMKAQNDSPRFLLTNLIYSFSNQSRLVTIHAMHESNNEHYTQVHAHSITKFWKAIQSNMTVKPTFSIIRRETCGVSAFMHVVFHKYDIDRCMLRYTAQDRPLHSLLHEFRWASITFTKSASFDNSLRHF